MARKNRGIARSRKRVAAPRTTAADSPDVLSPAAGVRALRRVLEARSASSRSAPPVDAVAASLLKLEADYERARRATNAATRFQSSANVPARKTPSRQRPAVSSTSPRVVRAILRIAAIAENDVVYDIGCGDGRLVMAAVKQRKVKGVGVDMDQHRIAEAKARAPRSRSSGRLRFVEASVFDVDLRPATVVVLHQLPAGDAALRRRLLDQLKPGARIVSHTVDMGDWLPTYSHAVEGHHIRCWVVPGHRSPMSHVRRHR